MMNTVQPRMTHLFQQLGLEANEAAIADFIKSHQLTADVHISCAPYWNPAQRAFISEKLAIDDNWAVIVDQLNEALHESIHKPNL